MATGIRSPELYVLPMELVSEWRREQRGWHKLFLRDIADLARYRENVEAIRDHLAR
jgi:hypothetical protein